MNPDNRWLLDVFTVLISVGSSYGAVKARLDSLSNEVEKMWIELDKCMRRTEYDARHKDLIDRLDRIERMLLP